VSGILKFPDLFLTLSVFPDSQNSLTFPDFRNPVRNTLRLQGPTEA